MARKAPVTIWIIRHSPRSEPKFHMYLKLEGAGRSTSDKLIWVSIWWDLRIGAGNGSSISRGE